jgi:hypothetical protein
VGTFGVGSIAYYWSRLAAAFGRLVSRLWGNECAWQFIFADDLHINCGGPFKYLIILSSSLTWIMIGTPFAWKKFRGGLCLDWCGYYLDYHKYQLGISEARSRWLLDFFSKTLRDRTVLMRNFVEALGRVGFSSQVLTWAKPYLAPLYAWAARVPEGTTLRLPEVVAYTLLFLQEQLSNGKRLVPCSSPELWCRQLFRTDAKCAEDKVVLAGWWCNDTLVTSEVPWFSLELTPSEVPWLFKPDKGSSWASTSAEMLAVIVALHHFENLLPKSQRLLAPMVIRAGTDNQALESLSRKRSSTKLPLLFVMMQLATTSANYNLKLQLQWRPREHNVEADALTNSDFSMFDPAKRVVLPWSSIALDLLGALIAHARSFEADILKNRQDVDLMDSQYTSQKRRKRAGDKTVWG